MSLPEPLSLALVLHAHQPVDNFDHVVEQTYQTSYLPFLDAAEARPWLKFNLHFSGWLLAWVAERHPDYVARLRSLVAAQRLEMLGGGYFEPILAAIPDGDKQEQIFRLRTLLREQIGQEPRGIWLTERVWQPELPASLAAAGVEYAVVDDTHLLMAGLEPEQTYGYFLTEYGGARPRLIASNKFLRFAMPFRPEEEALQFLVATAQRQPGALLTMGDDLEKFGSWPHTFAHVYRDGWLRRFLDGLERQAERVATVRVSDYLMRYPASGLVYLPTASYEEMMQWALPTPAAEVYAQALADPAITPYLRFLAGAPWRSFLTKYREANAMHKRALALSQRLERLGTAVAPEARTHLLAAECNDAYWHGLFGGLYAPHLRNSVYTRLLRAEEYLQRVEPRPALWIDDENMDGRQEIELRNDALRAVVSPLGAVVDELDFLPAYANLINSLQRRPELYHEQIRRQVAANPARLPGGAGTGAESLGSWLQYDRYPRSCCRLYLFRPDKTYDDFLHLSLAEDADAAGGEYAVAESRRNEPAVVMAGWAAGVPVRKRLGLTRRKDETGLECRIQWPQGLPPGPWQAGVEMVFNLLAPAAKDRRLVAASRTLPLDWQGELEAPELILEDDWRHFRLLLAGNFVRCWWLRPIYTVSQSEGGYEKVYQGLAVLAVGDAETEARTLELTLRVLPAILSPFDD